MNILIFDFGYRWIDDWYSSLAGSNIEKIYFNINITRNVSYVNENRYIKLFRFWRYCPKFLLKFYLRRHKKYFQKKTIDLIILTNPLYYPIAKIIFRDKTKFVYHISDLFTEYAGWSRSQVLRLEKEIVCDGVSLIFVSSKLQQCFSDRYGFKNKSMVLPNYSCYVASDNLSHNIKRNVLILGALNSRVDIDSLLEILDKLVGCFFNFIGGGLEENIAFFSKRYLGRATFHGFLDKEEIRLVGSKCYFSIIAYNQSDFNLHCSPVRFFDSLSLCHVVITNDAVDQIREFNSSRVVYFSSDLCINNILDLDEKLTIKGDLYSIKYNINQLSDFLHLLLE